MINFLLENFPLLIIVIGGLLSLFGGDKNKSEKQTPRPKASTKELEKTPPFGSGGSPFNGDSNPFDELRRELQDSFGKRRNNERESNSKIEPQQTESSMESVVRSKEADIKNQVHEKLAQAEQILQEKKKEDKQQLQRDLDRIVRVSRQIKMEDKVIVPKVTRASITQGIIWSEVLGPPRAKKPYRSNVYQK